MGKCHERSKGETCSESERRVNTAEIQAQDRLARIRDRLRKRTCIGVIIQTVDRSQNPAQVPSCMQVLDRRRRRGSHRGPCGYRRLGERATGECQLR